MSLFFFLWSLLSILDWLSFLLILHHFLIIFTKEFFKFLFGHFVEINIIFSQRLKSILDSITEWSWLISNNFLLLFNSTINQPLLIFVSNIIKFFLWQHGSKWGIHFDILLTLSNHFFRCVHSQLFQIVSPLNILVCW